MIFNDPLTVARTPHGLLGKSGNLPGMWVALTASEVWIRRSDKGPYI
jgi:hypothetical protein